MRESYPSCPTYLSYVILNVLLPVNTNIARRFKNNTHEVSLPYRFGSRISEGSLL